MYITRRPFSFQGEVNAGRGWTSYNGVVRPGWQIRCSPSKADELIRSRLVSGYATKEDKRAYIVHTGGSWFEVRYGTKVHKVQGKAKAEELRDSLNAKDE